MKRYRIACLLTVLLFILSAAQGETALTTADQKSYEMMMIAIDDGDSASVAEMLLDGSISQQLRQFLLSEDEQLLRSVVTDVMIRFGQADDVFSVAALRLGGYVTDRCFEDYWEAMGSEMPVPAENGEEPSDVDEYLLHELTQAYSRSDYAVRGLGELRSSGMLDDAMHAELVKMLGFDYTDEGYMDANAIAPLRVLEPDEKAVYDAVLVCIDNGDCASVGEMLYFGRITPNVYDCLMRQDGETMDLVIAQALAEMTGGTEPKAAVQLRTMGFVSDACFDCYWENLGAAGLDSDSEMQSGVDRYLLHELDRIRKSVENGEAIVYEIWQSGLLNDEVYAALGM